MKKFAPTLLAAMLAASSVSAAPPDIAPPRGSVQVDRKYMIGFWTDDGDCSNAIQLTEDGRFFTSEDTQGVWSFEGDRLTMTGSATATVRIVAIDRDTIDVISEDGSIGHSTRCAERTAPAAGAETA